MNPVKNGQLVDILGSAVQHGGDSLESVPVLVKRLLQEDAWRDFQTQLGERVTYDRFEHFVMAKPLRGLGATMDMLRNMVRGDPVALDLLDRALKAPSGRHRGGVDNINTTSRPSGTSVSQALRRLRKDRPDLHARVLAGELSPHAAMVEAGFRSRAVTVRVDSTAKLAASLRRHLSKDEIEALLQELSEGEKL